MKEGIRLFRIFGIQISLDFSWFIIFFLVSWSLASGYFPFKYPFFTSGTYWVMGVISSVLLFVTVLMHELSHSVVANYNGLGIRGIKLFIFGGVAQLKREPDNARVEFDIAIAGPICSFILHFIFKGIAAFLSVRLSGGAYNPVVAVFAYLGYINLFLGVINLVPAFPLDGGRVLRAFLWSLTKDMRKATAVASGAGKIFAMFIIFTGFMATIRGDFGGLWYVFIGMFLYGAAKTGYENVMIKDKLSDSLVRDVMSLNVVTVDGKLSLNNVVENYFFRYHHSSFPVIENGKVIGMLRWAGIREVPRNKWEDTIASSCVEPLKENMIFSTRDKTSSVLSRVSEEEDGHFLVMDGGNLVGIITRMDIVKLLKLKMDIGG